MKILAIGGAGNVGSLVVRELIKRNAEVRVLVRKREKAHNTPENVELVEGDLLDPPAIEKALDGVDKLYLLNAVIPEELTQGLIAYGLAKKRKIRHVLYHSVFQAERFKDVAHFAAKFAIEEALKEFDVPFTIIRPGWFFQNDKSVKDVLLKAGVYPTPLGPVGIAAVDVQDIAEASAIALTDGGHEGKTYNLVGPQMLSGPMAARIWSEVLKKEVRYGGNDMDAFEEQMRKAAPSWMAFDIRMMHQGYLERGFAAEPGDIATVSSLLGHEPRSYETFARETAKGWSKH